MLLTNAGVSPVIKVSTVDEEALTAALSPIAPADLCLELAKAKARNVAEQCSASDDVIVLGCDSVLDVDGEAYGKPGDAAAARARWKQMAGRRLAKTSISLRRRSSAASGRNLRGASAHFGPPTAPISTASTCRARATVSSVIGAPYLS